MNLPEQDKLKIGQEVSQNIPTPKEPEHAVNKGYVDGFDTSKEVKEIPNTTQYTVVAEDVDKVLDFTANAGEEIDLIIDTGVIPANKSIQFISSGNNVLIPVAGTGVTLAQTNGSKLKSRGKGSFVEILATNVAEIFAVTGDLEKDIIKGKDVHLRSANDISEIRFYDSETTDNLYFYLRGNASENIFEIGSKDGGTLDEVTAMFFDRGKDFAVSKGYFRSLNPNAALTIQTPNGSTDFKNPNKNIQLSSDGDLGIKAVRLESSAGDFIVWQSKSHGTTAERPTSATHLMYEGLSYFDTDLGKPIWWDGSQWIDISGGGGSIQNITEIPNRSYNDLQDKPTLFDGDYNSLSNKPPLDFEPSFSKNSGFNKSFGYDEGDVLEGNQILTKQKGFIGAGDSVPGIGPTGEPTDLMGVRYTLVGSTDGIAYLDGNVTFSEFELISNSDAEITLEGINSTIIRRVSGKSLTVLPYGRVKLTRISIGGGVNYWNLSGDLKDSV